MNSKVVKYTPVFEANRNAYLSGKYRFISNEGSTRSSKSYSLAQLIVVIALTEKKQITVTSPSLPHLKRGAMKDIIDVIKDWDLYNESNHNKTDSILKFPDTGSYIEFFGADESGKLRGPGRDILWCNEMNLIAHASYIQLALRTKDVIFGDLNPADEYSYVYQLSDQEGNIKIHSTYKNNPFLTNQQIAEIESLQDADENLWKVYGLGLRGTSTETIYTHWKECESFPACDDICYGLDFGFNHPTALIKIGFKEGKVYAEEQIYESKLTNDDLTTMIKGLGIGRATEIFAETARPEAVEEIRRAGLNIKLADKSVIEGIKMVKSMPLFVTRGSVNLIKELKSYKWKVDKNGLVLDEPVKFRDDACDALRYGIYTRMFSPRRIFADA